MHRLHPRNEREASKLLVTKRDEGMGVVFDFSEV